MNSLMSYHRSLPGFSFRAFRQALPAYPRITVNTTISAASRAGTLQPGARLANKPSSVAPRQIVSETSSLTALVRQVHLSPRWENAAWTLLGLTGLLLLVLSFAL